MNERRSILIALILAVLAFCFFEFVMHRESGVFREYETAFLSLQWMLLVCLAVWCGMFLFLTFSLKDWALIGLLIIVVTFYFIGYTVHPSRDALTLLAGLTLGRGAGFALQTDKRYRVKDEADSLEIVSRQSPSGNFLVGLAGLLVFAAWWHLEMSDSYYHGPRWMGLWNNPNTYGMLMGAGGLLALGMFKANLKFKIKNAKTNSSQGGEAHFDSQYPAIGNETLVEASLRRLLRGFLFIAAGMMFVGLMMSYSRGAWLGTGIGLIYLAWSYDKMKWRWVLPIVVGVAAMTFYFWGGTPDSAPWYVKRADLSRPSAQHRATAWRAGLEIMRDHPLGVGWNNAVSVYAKNYSPPEDGAAAITTNDYLMLGTELGLAALLCFVSYIAICLRGKCRIKNEAGRIQVACRASVMVLLVAFWFDGGLFKLPTAALFWVLLELGSSSVRTEKISQPSTHKLAVR